jgi:hypothetical protein
MMRDVIAGMATYPPRFSFCLEAVSSIAPQVDRLYLYVNEQGENAPFEESDTPENVVVLWSGEERGEMRDAGKFVGAFNREDVFYLSCDDDLIYPEEYVSALVSALREGEAACGFHGCVVPDYVGGSYYQNRQYVYHYKDDVRRPKSVNVLGTGVAGFDLEHVSFHERLFGPDPMADLYVAHALQYQEIPSTVLAHSSGWIRKNPKTEQVPEIHEDRELDKRQAEFINSHSWALYG